MKRTFTFLTYFFTLITISSEAQWNNSAWGSTLNGNASGSGGFVSIYSSLKSVDGGNFTAVKLTGNNYNIEDANIASLMAQVPLTKRLKAKAGEPFTIDVHTAGYAGTNFANPAANIAFWNVDTSGVFFPSTNPKMPNGIGQSGDPSKFSEFFSWQQKTPLTYYASGSVNYEDYKKEFVFTKGSNEGYIIFRLVEREYMSNFGFGVAFPTGVMHTTVLFIPFVVEGPLETTIQPLGVITKPKVPRMVLHRPPGDQSTAFISKGQKSCRSFEESFEYTNDISGYGSIKWGTKMDVGIVISQELEAYLQVTGSVGGGSVDFETSSKEECIEITSDISITSLDDGSPGGDVFIGYGFDAEYGNATNLFINPATNQIEYNKGIYLVQQNPIRDFTLSESGIIADSMSNWNDIINNPNVAADLKVIARNQNDAWEKVLAMNKANILAAKSGTPIAIKTYEGAVSEESYTETLNVFQTQTIETSSFISGGVAVDFLIEYGGAGIAGGVNWQTSSTFGASTEVSVDSLTSIGYTLQDGDNGDKFNAAVYRDPVYGTTVFDLIGDSKSSCPFEGGFQRDQPRITVTGVGPYVNVGNVTLGSPAQFNVTLNNDSNESRSYKLGVKNLTLPSNFLVQANGATNITSSPTELTVSPGVPQVYSIDISRPNPTSPTAHSGLELEWYAGCETEIRDSVLVDFSWATPPPPTLGPLPLENRDRFILLCQGVQDLTLTTTCTNGTVPHWYTSQVGGLEEGQGSPFVLTNIDPSIRTNYYVSCESDNYISPRVLYGRLYQSYEPTADNLNLTGYTHFGYYVANETLEVSAYNNNTRFYPTAFRAGNSVTLLPGFETLGERGLFSAEIGGCP